MGIFQMMFLIFLSINYLESRPISYSGGHTLMHFNDSMKESIYYHYSPTYKFSIGLETMQNKVFSNNETNASPHGVDKSIGLPDGIKLVTPSST